MYSFSSRVRYSELDLDGKLSIKALINYFQDCSTFESQSLGLGIDYMKNKKIAWWIYAWNIDIISLPLLGDEIIISTSAYSFKGAFAYRNFSIQDVNKNYLVKANSKWFMYDLGKRQPIKAEACQVSPYITKTESFCMSPFQRLPRHLENGRYLKAVEVSKYHLDTNKHMNNAVYAELATNCVDDIKFSNISIWYKRMALYKDIIYPYIAEDADKLIVELNDKNNKIFAYVSMTKLKE